MENPLVSIVIPIYNRVNIVSDTLNSVLEQTYSNWECIVIDDGSTDNTQELLINYSKLDDRFKWYQRPDEKIKGANSCRNYGFELSEGKYILFLDSDDLLLEECVKTRVERVLKYDNKNFYVFPMFTQSENIELSEKVIPEKENYLIEFLSYNLLWQTMCSFWTREYFVSIKGFNEELPRLNDPDIHIRAILFSNNNFKVFFNEAPDSIHKITSIKNRKKFSQKYFESLNLFIPSISSILIEQNKREFSCFLIYYLRNFLLFFSFELSKGKVFKLILLFFTCKIINKKKTFDILFYYGLTTSLPFLKSKIDYRLKKALSVE